MGCVCRAGPDSGVFSSSPTASPQQNINNHDMLDVLVEQPAGSGGRELSGCHFCMPQSRSINIQPIAMESLACTLQICVSKKS